MAIDASRQGVRYRNPVEGIEEATGPGGSGCASSQDRQAASSASQGGSACKIVRSRRDPEPVIMWFG